MQEKLIKGATLASAVKEEIKEGVKRLGFSPCLVAVIASEDPASVSYVQSKAKAAHDLGIEYRVENLGASCNQERLNKMLNSLSINNKVHGVILELPLAKGLSQKEALQFLTPKKDVDGMTPHNMGLLLANEEESALTPATPQACIELAETTGALAGKKVTVVGRGATVGKPLITMLINRSATVTVCHTKTKDLVAATKDCELLFVAAGKAGLINGSHVKAGQVVIDAGINSVGGKTVGDVLFDEVAPIVSAITPTPGGVGPLTSAIIFRNLLKAVKFNVAQNS